jgi:PKD repeat protein
VNTGGNTALNHLDPVLTNRYGLSAAVLLEDLTGASDHLPVVADYTIPIPLPVTPPVASFTATPTNGVAPLAVTFTAASTGGTNWSWAFGDGGTTNLATNSVFYTYNTPGVYSVTEIVSGTGGSSTDTVADDITALTPPPVASFTASPTNGAVPLTVGFTDQSSGLVTGWAWTFGDGNTSSSQNPSNTYVNPGSYTVQQIVTGTGGSSTDTVTNLINVYNPFAWWQLQYFGSTNNNASTAPGGDYTGTGMSNTNEFLAGFNPTNSAAYLHIISIVESVVGGNTNVVVTYLGPNGDNTYTPGIALRTNVLDYTTGDANGSYTNGGWEDTGQTNILGGGNGSGIVTNMTDMAIPSTSTNRYYRVRVLLP